MEPRTISPVSEVDEPFADVEAGGLREEDNDTTANDDEAESEEPESHAPARSFSLPVRRLSTYTISDGGMDLEDDVIGGSARPQSYGGSVGMAGSWRPGSWIPASLPRGGGVGSVDAGTGRAGQGET